MMLPDIDFYEIRRHNGDQANAFEELCCQLANDEPLPDRLRFDRKGRGGDAGVECFATHRDGSETGWQVKFYSDFDSMLRSLDGSLSTALEKHPSMRRFVACFPFDLADSRRPEVTTALSKWDVWSTRRIAEASKTGRDIAIDRWDAHELKQRLVESNPRSAGRVAFWFDREMLTNEWFRNAFERTVDSLGDRYSPETHIDLPVRRSILATLRDPVLFAQLRGDAERVEALLSLVQDTADEGARASVRDVIDDLIRLAVDRPNPFPIDDAIVKAVACGDAVSSWYERLRALRGGDRPIPAMITVANLVASLRAAIAGLRASHWRYVDSPALLVLGEAGTGKSHLLADTCAHQLDHHLPAIMVLGGKLPDGEPWGEILRDLDFAPRYGKTHFLGALNAAGEAAGLPALVAIDALNEKNGQSIWPERLAGLLKDARAFPWIRIILSCRTTYKDIVIPSALDEAKLARVEHEGFDDAQVLRYLKRRGISVPDTPRQLEEIRNPLFLRLVCDALDAEGEVLVPEALGGISDVFKLFTSAVGRRVEASLNVAPHRNLVMNALRVLAREMSESGRGEVGFARADELIRAVHDGSQIGSDLLFQLENEGFLQVEQDAYSSVGSRHIVRFTFERMGDHVIVADLLERGGTSRASDLCAPTTPLFRALSDPESFIKPGILQALAVQLPERFGVELPDLVGIPDGVWSQNYFEESLLTRRSSAFTDRTWTLIEAGGDTSLRFETLIALATEPDHPFNVRVLDAELRPLPMRERDARWSTHLASSERAMHLVDWAREADQERVSEARAALVATQLGWFLTATSRTLRDLATKALAAVLADRPALAVEVWRHFRGLDDGYVTERVVAAIYGAAMQGRWPCGELTEVAVALHADLFRDRSPPVNSLLRDHAAGLVGYALQQCGDIEGVDAADLDGPFASPWPIDHVPDALIESYTRDYGRGGRMTDEIVDSCLDGDFGRYVLDYAVQDWSPARAGTWPLPNALELREQWHADFVASATPEMIAAHLRLLDVLEAEGAEGHVGYGESHDRIAAAKAEFREAVGPDTFEKWREKAEYWRADGMYQSFARRGPAEFNLAWARRWVVMRAHELGWSEALHGQFDRGIRGDRNEHSLERIGKKYQWLALYELVARMGDNLASLPDRSDDTLRLRNIDPSLLIGESGDDESDAVLGATFWAGSPPLLPAQDPEEALAWLHSSEDVLDDVANIDVRSADGRSWLVLTGFEVWRAPMERLRSEAWRRVGCIVVASADRDVAVKGLSSVHMTGPHDMPSAEGGGYRVHLGEYPWRSLAPDHDDWIEDWRPPGTRAGKVPSCTIRPTTSEYVSESGGYDGSITTTLNLPLPARWLMDGLGLRLSDGRSMYYSDATGVVRFMDPSVSAAGRSAALVDRQAFLELLTREGLVAIWTIAGEKNAYGPDDSRAFGGRFTYTRVFYSDGSEIRAGGRLEGSDKPSPGQLADFLGKPQPDVVEVDDVNDGEAEVARWLKEPHFDGKLFGWAVGMEPDEDWKEEDSN